MGWIATIDVPDDRGDEFSARLWELGTTGVAELADPLGARLVAGFESESAANAAIVALGHGGSVTPIQPDAWAPPGITEINVGEHRLTIDAQHSFGHGAHPTTRLCLDLMVRHLVPDESVLDVGTGSGVLAVAAMKLGASHALGIDIDPSAVQTAMTNGSRNRTEARFETTPIADVPGPFSLIVVNMLIAELEPIGRHIRRLQPAQVIVSGCLTDQASRVSEALRRPGDEPPRQVDRMDCDGWVGLVLAHSPSTGRPGPRWAELR